uniref:Uncharacterized protein n=1 Tax=Arundo donax TaxID=35708 RepID=A0A0A9G9I4_ARUDO
MQVKANQIDVLNVNRVPKR